MPGIGIWVGLIFGLAICAMDRPKRALLDAKELVGKVTVGFGVDSQKRWRGLTHQHYHIYPHLLEKCINDLLKSCGNGCGKTAESETVPLRNEMLLLSLLPCESRTS